MSSDILHMENIFQVSHQQLQAFVIIYHLHQQFLFDEQFSAKQRSHKNYDKPLLCL